jgi:hypothetical protein
MFEVLDTGKVGTISIQEFSRFIQMIFKMKECNFDLEKYIDTVSGTGGDALLNQSNDINLSLNLGEKE